MKELSIQEKAKAYDEALEIINDYYQKIRYSSLSSASNDREVLEKAFPVLKENEDERIREELLEHCKKQAEIYNTLLTGKEYGKVQSWLAWLEKQGEPVEINLVEILKHYPRETELYSPMYGKLWLAEVDEEHEIITCYKHRLPKGCVRAVLEQEDTISFYSNGTTGLPDFSVSKDCMLFLYDIEKQREIDEEKVLIGARKDVALSIMKFLDRCTLGMCLSDLERADLEDAVVNSDWPKVYDYMKKKLEKQGEKPQGKSALEAIKEEKVDNQNCIKPTNKVEPKFKVKYANGEYNVLEIKEIAGVTYYGIEDEPNHIDYVLPDNCEIVSEQKLAEIIPKFKVGGFIVNNNSRCVFQVTEIRDDEYCLYPLYGEIMGYLRIIDVDNEYHLWTIADAKDGDVLQLGLVTAIFQEYIGNGKCKCYCSICGEFCIPSQDGDDNSYGCSDAAPATKEQRNTLFKAMTNAGYTFDFEKKVIKKRN